MVEVRVTGGHQKDSITRVGIAYNPYRQLSLIRIPGKAIRESYSYTRASARESIRG